MKFPIRPIHVKFHFKKKHLDKIYVQYNGKDHDVRNNEPQNPENKKH